MTMEQTKSKSLNSTSIEQRTFPIKQMTFYTCRRELVDTLTGKQIGEVLEALFRYTETGEKQQFNDQATQKVFSILCEDMEREASHE